MPPDIQHDPKIAEIVSRLVASVDPDRIILFGSRARGEAGARSDFDILIVKASSETRYHRLRPARASLFGVGAPVDLLWYTPEELEDWADVRGHVAAEALREGVVLYAKAAA
ncbi:MAG: nucleotidyltransferase domain-containing protein [Acidobacteria bacterium]|nr:nucleotidyltransferase domain-containing protein [Acidobacteriota bacterium]